MSSYYRVDCLRIGGKCDIYRLVNINWSYDEKMALMYNKQRPHAVSPDQIPNDVATEVVTKRLSREEADLL